MENNAGSYIRRAKSGGQNDNLEDLGTCIVIRVIRQQYWQMIKLRDVKCKTAPTITGESTAPAEVLELRLSSAAFAYFHSTDELPTAQINYRGINFTQFAVSKMGSKQQSYCKYFLNVLLAVFPLLSAWEIFKSLHFLITWFWNHIWCIRNISVRLSLLHL